MLHWNGRTLRLLVRREGRARWWLEGRLLVLTPRSDSRAAHRSSRRPVDPARGAPADAAAEHPASPLQLVVARTRPDRIDTDARIATGRDASVAMQANMHR
jgi:hypothetical protein